MSCFIKSSSVMVTFRSPRPRPSEMCLRNKENDSLSPPVTKHRKRQHEVVWWDRNCTHIQTQLSCHTFFFALPCGSGLAREELIWWVQKDGGGSPESRFPIIASASQRDIVLGDKWERSDSAGVVLFTPLPPPQTSPMIRSAPLPRPRW